MKRSLIMMAALTFSLALYMPLALATTPQPVAQDPAADEAAAYKAWYDANAAKDIPKAVELAKAYLEKFPAGRYADYLKTKWIPQTNNYLFNQAVQAKNTAEIIRIGKEVLAREPENLDYLSALVVQLRTLELFANPANFSHAAEVTDFAERTIRLIEAGKTPTGADKNFNKNVTLAYMHQTLAAIYDHDKKVDKALAQYEKAGTLEPTNATYSFHCGRIHNDKYAAAAQKYEPAQKKSEELQKKVQAIPEADRTAAEPKPEVKNLLAEAKTAQDEEKALLAEVNGQADAVITCWARFLGLTIEKNPWGDTRAQVEKALTALYKYRHNDSTEGLQKLIDQSRPAPPANSTNTATATPKP